MIYLQRPRQLVVRGPATGFTVTIPDATVDASDESSVVVIADTVAATDSDAMTGFDQQAVGHPAAPPRVVIGTTNGTTPLDRAVTSPLPRSTLSAPVSQRTTHTR